MSQIRFLSGQILFNAGSIAMDAACCCQTCDCTFANQITPNGCQYATSDYQDPATWPSISSYQVDISGSCTHRTVYNQFGTAVCTPASCNCPSGTYLVTCGSSYGYYRRDVVCETASDWYVTELYYGINGGGNNQCNSNNILLQVQVCSETYRYPKSGSLPANTGSGWISFGWLSSIGGTYGNVLYKTWKSNQAGYNYYIDEISGNCTSACATVGCVPSFPNNFAIVTNTNTIASTARAGCNPTGLSFAVQAVA